MSERVLLPLLFSAVVSALPTASHPLDSSASTSLAVVFTFVCFLLVLFTIKRIYIRRRRVHTIHHGPAPCPSLQSCQRSSTSFFYFSDEKPFKIDRTAFWVGLLGSPSWETSIKASNKFGAHRYSFIQHIHSKPRSQNTLSSLGSKLSVTEFGARRYQTPHLSSTTTETRTLSSTLQPSIVSDSLQLPAYPAEVRTSLSKHRRLSLPEQCQSSANHAEYRKRHSSLNDRSKRCSSDHPRRRSSWLRRIDPSITLSDTQPLSLSPKDSASSFLDLAPGSSRFGSKSKPTFRSEKHGVPSLTLSGSVTLETLGGKSFISHPYALGPKKSSGEVLPPAVPTRITKEIQLPSIPQPAAYPASYATKMPGSPKNASTLPRRKPKTRSPSVRSRKSPPIGPSPLRIMTLPEKSITDLNALVDGSILPSDTVRNESEPVTSKPQAQESSGRRDMYSQLGIGYPSIWGIDKKEVEIQASRATDQDLEASDALNTSQEHSPSTTSPSPSTADMMLDIIRELVEETSQWDASLYMDDSFKALIQNSTSKLSLQVLESQSSEDKPQSLKSPRSSQSFMISVSNSSGDIDQLQGLFDLEMYEMTVDMAEDVVSPDDQKRLGSTFIHGQPLDILEETSEESDGVDGNYGNEKKVDNRNFKELDDIGLAV